MIKVLHCLNFIHRGAVGILRVSIFQRLDKRQYQHKLICVKILDDAFAAEIRSLGIDILETGNSKIIMNPRRYLQAIKIIHDWKPDIVHGAVIEGYTLSAFSGVWFPRVPVILEETNDPLERRPMGHALVWLACILSDVCVGVSPAISDYLTKTLKISERKVRTIPNGVEEPATLSVHQKLALRRELNIEENELIIGSVGYMYRGDRKGFRDAIRVTQKISETHSVRLLIVGSGSEFRELCQFAKDVGAADKVVFAGHRDDVAPFYCIMDIFLLLSSSEAFGLVNAEAMRSGLPVVASNVCGIPYIVLHGETGFLVRPGDLDDAERRLIQLVTDDDLRKFFGARGKERADKYFSSKAYVGHIEGLYNSIIKSKTKPPIPPESFVE